MAKNNTSVNTGKHGRSDLVSFGNTGIYVSRMVQGTAFRNMPRSPENQVGLRVLQHCLDVGLNFFASGGGYGMGGSERLLAKAIAGRRDQAVICNKMVNMEVPDDAKEGDVTEFSKYTRDFIFGETDRSLKRLGTDYIDFLVIGRPDGVTQLKGAEPEQVETFLRRYKDGADPTSSEELVDTMDALVKTGKVRYWGVTNRSKENIVELMQVCEKTGKAPVSCFQYNYCLPGGRAEGPEDLFPLIRRTGVGLMTHGPHGAGDLVPGYVAETGSALADALEVLDGVAGDLGVPRSQVCVAWVLSHPEVIAPLAGAESPEHVDDNLAGSMLELPAEAILALNTARDAYNERKAAGTGGLLQYYDRNG